MSNNYRESYNEANSLRATVGWEITNNEMESSNVESNISIAIRKMSNYFGIMALPIIFVTSCMNVYYRLVSFITCILDKDLYVMPIRILH